MEADHVQDPDLGHRGPESVRFTCHAGAHQQAAVGTPLDAELVGRGPDHVRGGAMGQRGGRHLIASAAGQPRGTGQGIVEDVLLVGEPAVVVPGTPVFAPSS